MAVKCKWRPFKRPRPIQKKVQKQIFSPFVIIHFARDYHACTINEGFIRYNHKVNWQMRFAIQHLIAKLGTNPYPYLLTATSEPFSRGTAKKERKENHFSLDIIIPGHNGILMMMVASIDNYRISKPNEHHLDFLPRISRHYFSGFSSRPQKTCSLLLRSGVEVVFSRFSTRPM